MSEAQRWTVMLWGDSGTGKSTLLTAALYATEAGRLNAVVDRTRSGAALATQLLPQWRRLSRSQPLAPTALGFADLPLVTKSGNILCLRDTRGSIAGALETPAVLDALQSDAPHACVFVLEWRARDLTNQLLALTGALDLFGDRPCALVFTKCEQALDEGDPRWRGEPGWWRSDPALASHERTLSRFGDAVWPSSAYGFHARLGTPAVLLGEFGQLLPYEISPRGVHAAFDWLLDSLGVA